MFHIVKNVKSYSYLSQFHAIIKLLLCQNYDTRSPERIWRKPMELKEGLRKVFLAGVGTLSSTKEKSEKLIDDLVKKGELTVEEGKTLNKDLAAKVTSGAADLKSKTTDLRKSVRSVLLNVERMSREDRDELLARIEAANKAEDDAKEAEGQIFVDETIAAVTEDPAAEAADDEDSVDPASAAFDAVSKEAEKEEDPTEEDAKTAGEEYVKETIDAVTEGAVDEDAEDNDTLDPVSAAFESVAEAVDKEE